MYSTKKTPLAYGAKCSTYLMPTLRETPEEAHIASHRLMLRAGLIRQSSAGIYNWLPMGFRVLQKVADIIREEQTLAGAHELLMPTIQSAELWQQSGRYEDYGKEMLRISDRHNRPMLYGPTNEEQITQIMANNIQSYRDLPKLLYHIQWKFRDEIRPSFGVMRGREFLMKDGYSFDIDEKSAKHAYHKMFIAYLRTYARLGLKAIPMRAPSGPIGGECTHEFIVLAPTGESEVFCHQSLIDLDPLSIDFNYDDDIEPIVKKWTDFYAATDEMHDPQKFMAEVPKSKQITSRGIEVGHIFLFGDKYSKMMNGYVKDQNDQSHAMLSGSYGIGVSRLLGAIIEVYHDEKGIIWPQSIAPFSVGINELNPDDSNAHQACSDLYHKLRENAVEVLWDDRKGLRAGVKFGDMDLIGLPWQLVIGPKAMREGKVELKERKTGESVLLTPSEAIEKLIRDC
ncbi:MAG: proline--tRNA ligase [Pseudomonadota bacterium]